MLRLLGNGRGEDVSEMAGTVKTVIGLMSGTSMDGIDAAVVWTDGETIEKRGAALTLKYGPEARCALRDAAALAASLPGSPDVPDALNEVGRSLADWHADAVTRLLDAAGLASGDVDLIGFHGHTVFHAPRPRTGAPYTWQAGDADRLAQRIGIPVVSDFRSADLAQGGEGAPLASLYHAALLNSSGDGLASPPDWPVAILNLGGVGNVTFVAEGGIGAPGEMETILAFDTGPANALIDEWVSARGGQAFDDGGALSARGQVHDDLVNAALAHPYFARAIPKSLERLELAAMIADPGWEGLSLEDGAATRAAFTAASVAAARAHLPEAPAIWYVTGGGRHNRALMDMLRARLGVRVEPVEVLGWRGDYLEAEAFAFLAARSVRGLPLTVPGTTGVASPLTGGRLSSPAWPGRDRAVS